MWLIEVDQNQIKILLSRSELKKYGITEEDVENNSKKWLEIILRIIKNARIDWSNSEEGTIFIDVFSTGTDELEILITYFREDSITEAVEEVIFATDWPVVPKIEEGFEFSDFEDVVQLARRIQPFYQGGALYVYQNKYYLIVDILECRSEIIVPLLFEYGNKISVQLVHLKTKAKQLIPERAIQVIHDSFYSNR